MIALLNTTILTNAGDYRLTEISAETARRTCEGSEVKSFVGHQATADAMAELLGIRVLVNREQFSQAARDDAICLKLNGRLEEGKILSRDELEAFGYKIYWLERFC